MRKIKHYAIGLFAAIAATTMVSCGDDYNDTELRNEMSDLKSRVEKLEDWCKTTNTQISALQGLVSALEAKDFVTGVSPIMEGSKEIGYTITFSKSGPIKIYNGEDGVNGTDGITPIISAKADTDGLYYWTIKLGDNQATWLLSADGKKIRTTGDKGADGENGTDGEDGTNGTNGTNGHTPVISVDTFEGSLYWKVDGVWMLSNGQKVPATGNKGDKGDKGDTGIAGTPGAPGAQGPQGDAVFKKNGIDLTDPNNVTFTLADGVTKITLPKASMVTVGFSSYDTFYCSPTDNEMTLILPATLKETDYNAIIATISTANGTNMDIQTRSANTADNWGVKVTKPTFAGGSVVAGSAKVTLTLPQNQTNYKAVLRVTIVDNKGKEFSVSRIVWFKANADVNVIDNTSGDLSAKIANPSAVKQLSIIGSVSSNDFKFMRENLTSMEVLDLSRTTIASLPERAMAFYSSMGLTDNTTLKTVILPETLNTIGNSSFAMCKSLEYINIPANVSTLGRWMFEGCNLLTNIKLPGGLTAIPASAFYMCGIESIEIPSSVNFIGEWAFANCTKLVSANIPSGVTVLNEGLFAYCSNLQNISWHDNITSIGNDVFCICEKFSQKDLILPSKVTSIGMRAFSFTGITSVKLPQGLVSIDGAAFNQCPITTIDLPSSIASVHATAFFWSEAETVICRSTTPPAMPDLDDHNNKFPLFYLIDNSVCILKKPNGADYSGWSNYFKEIQNL